MIAVIADDLSGATELAGAAASSGFRAEVHTDFDPASSAEVIAVDTDTRSLPPRDAAAIVGGITRAILRARPSWIYKKTDSALRGNVRDEIEAILGATGMDRSVFIPANPSKGRVIRGGRYFIDEVPLDQTAFAHDPEHPRESSIVLELLGETSSIETPDAPDLDALKDQASRVTDLILPAGGVQFFEAILDTRKLSRGASPDLQFPPGLSLFICGSAGAWRLGREADFQRRRIPIAIMPDSLIKGAADGSEIEIWVDHISAEFERNQTVMMAIGRSDILCRSDPAKLLATLTRTASLLALRHNLALIFLEGGATAAAFVRRQNWTKLQALPCAAIGVAALSPVVNGETSGPILLVKPGSYPWPEAL